MGARNVRTSASIGASAKACATGPGAGSRMRAHTLRGTGYTSAVTRSLPEAIATAYVGGVNASTWRGYPARTWLFLEIDGSTDDNFWHRNQYAFIYNPRTWDEFQVYRDEHGRVPKEVATVDFSGATTSGNGWKRFRVQPEINFSTAFSWIS